LYFLWECQEVFQELFRYTVEMDWGTGVTSLGTTTLKEKQVTFGIKDEDRLRHLCVLGCSGSGRGEFIARMAFQDIERGSGTIILDAKGNVAPFMMERFGAEFKDRLVHVDPAEAEHPYTWNILNDIKTFPKEAQEEKLVRVLESVYQINQNPFARLLAPELLKKKDSSLVTFYRLLSDSRFRKDFFKDDAEGLEKLLAAFKSYPDMLADIEEKGRYIGKDTLVRNVLGQTASKFSLNDLPKGKVIIINLEKIRMFPTRMTPIVRLFVEAALMAGEVSGQPPALYIHDALRYLGGAEIERAFASRAVALTVADTVIQESDREQREHALLRCGSVVAFATHRLDRPLIERAFYPYVDPEELEQLEPKEFVATLAIDAVRTRPFFGTALPIGRSRSASYQDLITSNRERYTTSRTEVDDSFLSSSEEDDGPKGPRGFQDAFRAMFDKRAKGGVGGTPSAAKPLPKMESTQKGVAQPLERTSANLKTPQGNPAEVAESVLKQMLYVPAVS